MDFVRSRHGNAVWHRVSVVRVCVEDYGNGYGEAFMCYHTPCAPDGYTCEGHRTELISAPTPPGRLCRRCAKGMEVAA